REAIIDAISAVTSTLSCEELIARLAPVRVNVAKVNDIGEAADHPQLAAVGGVLELPLDGHTMKATASPFALHGPPTAPDRAPPKLGADTRQILADLGFDAGEIDALHDEGAFGAARHAR